jgi:hypothetical protein
MSVEESEIVIVERLTNLEDWEVYRFAGEDTDEAVCKVVLRADDGVVEYGVWKGDDAEPSATGSVAWEGPWGDEVRERVLREIVGAYEEALPEVRNGVEFAIGEGGYDDEGEHEDEDEDDELEVEEGDDEGA